MVATVPQEPKKRQRHPLIEMGTRFGRLVVTASIPPCKQYPRTRLECRCDCGETSIVYHENLRLGRTTSCGCFSRERRSELRKTHGLSKTQIYTIWNGMHERCTNPNSPAYKHYGGRGITICERWNSVENFVADVGLAPKGMSLNRKNNDGPYSPENCEWATAQTQMRNTRRTRNLTFNGKTQCCVAWAAELEMGRATLEQRLSQGWTVEEALTIPVGTRRKSEEPEPEISDMETVTEFKVVDAYTLKRSTNVAMFAPVLQSLATLDIGKAVVLKGGRVQREKASSAIREARQDGIISDALTFAIRKQSRDEFAIIRTA